MRRTESGKNSGDMGRGVHARGCMGVARKLQRSRYPLLPSSALTVADCDFAMLAARPIALLAVKGVGATAAAEAVCLEDEAVGAVSGAAWVTAAVLVARGQGGDTAQEVGGESVETVRRLVSKIEGVLQKKKLSGSCRSLSPSLTAIPSCWMPAPSRRWRPGGQGWSARGPRLQGWSQGSHPLSSPSPPPTLHLHLGDDLPLPFPL